MHITGLGTAVPPHRYTQIECLEAARRNPVFTALAPRSQRLIEHVLQGDNGIAARYLALDSIDAAFSLDPDTLHARFLYNAPLLASQAARQALDHAHLPPASIDAVIISTCTGYLCPGLTSYVIEMLGLRTDVIALDLVGQGCGAALPNLRTGEALLAAGQAQHVLSICVEICSAAFYLDDDPGVLISACLFGDGAGAAVLSSQPRPGQRDLEWVTARTQTHPADRDLLRFEQKKGMLRNILSIHVPQLAAQHAGQMARDLLGQAGLQPADFSTWIWHGGGRTVLDAIRDEIGLTDQDMRWSRCALDTYGNLSSAFVYFVLQAALAGESPDGWWWLASFGAGFSCHGALLRVRHT